MAGNALKNASFLDGAAGWNATTAAPTVDEAVRGAPGRAALVRDLARTVGQSLVVWSDTVACAAGALVEAHVLAVATAPLVVSVEFQDAGSALIGTAAVLPRLRSGDGSASRGVPAAYDFHAAQLVAPPGTAKARLVLTATAAVSGAVQIFLTKPYLNPAAPPLASGWRVWDPGPTDNPDLDRPRFPADLPPMLNDGYDCAPLPSRKAFTADAGVPTTIRINAGGWYKVSGAMRLTTPQHDALKAFWADPMFDRETAFWFVIPDTAELGLASWDAEDGDPRIVERRGPTRLTRIGLIVEVI